MKRCKFCTYDDNGNVLTMCIFCIIKKLKGDIEK